MMKEGKCPNYIESWWTPKEGGQPILIQDCAPKRTLIMVQDLYNKFETLQKEMDSVRNASEAVINGFNSKIVQVLLPGRGYPRRREELIGIPEEAHLADGPGV